MKPIKKNKQEGAYECECCGARADKPQQCCGKPMKKKK